MNKYPVRLTLTPMQAEGLLQLAQEAETGTILEDGEPDAPRRARAAETAMDRLTTALANAQRSRNCT